MLAGRDLQMGGSKDKVWLSKCCPCVTCWVMLLKQGVRPHLHCCIQAWGIW